METAQNRSEVLPCEGGAGLDEISPRFIIRDSTFYAGDYYCLKELLFGQVFL